MSNDRSRRVSAIIIARDAKDQLAVCMERLYDQRFDGEIEVIVVDNGSVESTAFLVTSMYPQVKLIKNDVNLGIAAAFNQAFTRATGDWVFRLDQDVEIQPLFINEALKTMNTDPSLGSVTGKLLSLAGPKQRVLIDSVGLMFRNCSFKIAGSGQKDGQEFDQPKHIFAAPGSAALYRRTMLEDIAIQGMVADENLFSFLEDLDIGWRAQLMNWKAAYTPKAKGLHKRGACRLANENKTMEYKYLFAMNLRLVRMKNLHEDLAVEFGSLVKQSEKRHEKETLRRAGFQAKMAARMWAMKRSKIMKQNNTVIQGMARLDKVEQKKLLFA